eukprot:CAMPEP_0201568644 /NCGR_PEP_ID=MMETSP0190_2-20130828/9858_1 /ASSEMBLY_ACC=CAM_ASM_000263 /TAXON_ID=37353 /ORGANISM="Rosalina sp." /LENGTH=130 /DNA_ID=CAMNT_0047990003 /DNA_START=18 /DNA_END=410 /DNA_ORIENTATION=+
MTALWNSFFGKDGVFIQVHETCRINYHGRPGSMVMDEGKVVGGYTDIFFYDDDGSERVRLFGGSLFNSQHEECKQKFTELKDKYGIQQNKKIKDIQPIYPSPKEQLNEIQNEDEGVENQIEGLVETEDIQ